MSFLAVLRMVERAFLVGVFLAMVLLFCINILAREVGFGSHTVWIEEAVRLLNLFLVFSALGLALERGRHVGIHTLRDQLPAALRRPLLKLIDAVGMLFSLYFAYLASVLVDFVLQTGQRSPTLELPMGWIYAAPVVGFGLLALRFGLSLCGVIDRFQRVPDAGDSI